MSLFILSFNWPTTITCITTNQKPSNGINFAQISHKMPKRFYIPGTRYLTVLCLQFPGNQWATQPLHVMTTETFKIQK